MPERDGLGLDHAMEREGIRWEDTTDEGDFSPYMPEDIYLVTDKGLELLGLDLDANRVVSRLLLKEQTSQACSALRVPLF